MATKTANQKGLAIAQAAYTMASPDFRSAIPEPTEDNVKEFMSSLTNYTSQYNEFMHIVEKIALQTVKAADSRNKLESVKKGMVEYGKTIEEIYADLIEVTDWNFSEGGTFDEIFGQKKPNVYSLYHSTNFNKVVARSIPDRIMRRGFQSWAGLNDIIGAMMKVMYSSMVDYEAQATEELLNFAHKAGHMIPVKVNTFDVTAVDEGKMKANTIIEASLVDRLGVRASRKYNYYGVSTMTMPENALFVSTPEYVRAQGVSVLAAAFNMNEAEFLGRVITVSGFGGAESDGCIGFLVDKDWFQIWEQGRQVTSEYNSYSRTWIYHYFVDAIYSYSLFNNAIEFVDSLKTITSVTVTASQSAKRGDGTQIEVKVVNGGEKGGWTSKCEWSIDGNKSAKTYITPNGMLFVGKDETAETINVTAKSAQDPAKTSTAAVTIVE